MFKTKRVRDLERLVRVRTAERDEALADYRAAHADIRYLAKQLAEHGQQARLHRALKACARYRRDISLQGRVTRRLADSLLDAVGHNADYLIPTERDALGLGTVKETVE